MGLREIKIVAPLRQDCSSNDPFSQDMFTIAKTGVTCPAGCRTIIPNTNKKTGMTTFYFKKEFCQHCVLKEACTKQERRTITIGPHHDLIVEAKKYNETQNFKDMKERAHIEPKHSEMKRNHGMVRAKYWGLEKLNIQLIITAITVNVKRLVNVLDSVCYLEKC